MSAGEPLVRADAPDLWARVQSVEDPRGTVTLVHGFGEHGGRYGHVQHALADAGWTSVAVDYRGWGRAQGPRAFLERFDDYLDDVDAMLALAAERGPAPHVLLGHSQGGLVAALHAIERGGAYERLVLCSPAFEVGLPVAGWKVALAHGFSLVWPRFALSAAFDVSRLCHDVEVQQAFLADPLVVRRGTARWFTEFLAAEERALAGAHTLTLPTLLLAGSEDLIVNPRAVRTFAERVPGADLCWYEGLRHELFNELERAQVLADLVAWLERNPTAQAG